MTLIPGLEFYFAVAKSSTFGGGYAYANDAMVARQAALKSAGRGSWIVRLYRCEGSVSIGVDDFGGVTWSGGRVEKIEKL